MAYSGGAFFSISRLRSAPASINMDKYDHFRVIRLKIVNAVRPFRAARRIFISDGWHLPTLP